MPSVISSACPCTKCFHAGKSVMANEISCPSGTICTYERSVSAICGNCRAKRCSIGSFSGPGCACIRSHAKRPAVADVLRMSCGCLADVELGYCFKRRTRQQLGMGLRKQQCIRCRLRQTRGQFDDKLFHRRLVPVPVQHQLFSAIAFSRDGGCIHCQGCPERMECWMRRHVPGRVPNHAQNGFDPIVFRPHGAGGLAGLAVAPMCIPTPPQKPQEGHRIPAMLTQRGVQRHGVPWCVPQGLCAAAHACVQGLPAPRCCKQLLGCLERNPVEPIDELLGGPGRLNGRHTRQKNVFCPDKTRDHNAPPALEFNTCGNRSVVQPRLAAFAKRPCCFFRQALAPTLCEDARNGTDLIDEGFIRVHGVPKSWTGG